MANRSFRVIYRRHRHLFPGAEVSHLNPLRHCAGWRTYTAPSEPVQHPDGIPQADRERAEGPHWFLPGDLALGESGLYWSARPRMLIENLEKSRSVRPRTAGKTSVEEKLVEILNAGGEDALNGVRDSRPWRWKCKLGKWQ